MFLRAISTMILTSSSRYVTASEMSDYEINETTNEETNSLRKSGEIEMKIGEIRKRKIKENRLERKPKECRVCDLDMEARRRLERRTS